MVMNSQTLQDRVQYLVIDLFCGAGGATTGIEQAERNGKPLARVAAAINHDPVAITSHKMNHEETKHLVEDIRVTDLSKLKSIVRYFRKKYPKAKLIIWASLECTNFSIAKGGKPRDADSRTLANDLIRYIKKLRPDYVLIENVKEFMAWGPLDENGRPISRMKGRDYIRWIERIQREDYRYDYRLLEVADYGVPQNRTRYFGIFAKGSLPIRFPEPTHAEKPGEPGLFGKTLKPWIPVKEVLELDVYGESIFKPGRIRSDRTFMRILDGLKRFVPEKKSEWLLQYRNNADGTVRASKSLDRPANTICTGYHPRLIQLMHNYYGSGGTHRSIDRPCCTIPTKDRCTLVTCQFLDKRYGTGVPSSIDRPAPAVTQVPKTPLVTCQFMDQQYGASKPKSLDQPNGSVLANPKQNLVTAQWVDPVQYNNPGRDVNRPSATITASRHWPYSVSAIEGEESPYWKRKRKDTKTVRAIREFMREHGIYDIKMRMLQIKELLRIQAFSEDYQLAGNANDKKKFIGNAVPPKLPKLWIEALAV